MSFRSTLNNTSPNTGDIRQTHNSENGSDQGMHDGGVMTTSNLIPKSVRGAMTTSTTSLPSSPIVACSTGSNVIGSRPPTDLMKRLQLTRGEMRRRGCMNRKTPRKTLLDRLSGPDHPSQTTMIPNIHRKEESMFRSSPGLTPIRGNHHPSQNLSNSPKLLSRISPAISSSPNPTSSIQSNVP